MRNNLKHSKYLNKILMLLPNPNFNVDCIILVAIRIYVLQFASKYTS